MDETWTIVELAELAAEALAVPGALRANGRVRDVPNERLIRWYGTVGLVDPPLSRKGRVARYGSRHLLQLVAVKRRQAEGKSLAQIQVELAGATDEVLSAVARIPGLGPVRAADPGPGPGPGPDPGPWPATGDGPATGRFWTRQLRQPVEEASAASADPDGDVPAAGLVHGIRLAPGVTLLLDGADREPGRQDVSAIADAARPLLSELARLGLAASSTRHPAETDQPQTGA